jgi:hypothetical protein
MGDLENENGNRLPFRLTLRDLPLPVRLTLSLFLISVGLGYFSALVQLHFKDALPGEALPTPDDLVEIFSGVENWTGKKPAPPKPVSKMEQLVMAPENLAHNGTGTMSFAFFGKKVKTEEERAKRQGEQLAIQAWIDAPEKEREESYNNDAFPLPKSLAANVKVKSIIDERCAKCHSDEAQEGKKKLVDYADFADVLTVPEAGHTSRQMSLEHLAQTTHLHLLTFCVLWMLTGVIFAFSSYPTWVRCILAPIVLLAQVADVCCWWLARLNHVGPYFALAIIATGTVVGFGLFLQIVMSLFNMYRLRGRAVLVLLLAAAIAGAVAVEPIIDGHLAQEKAATTSAPAAPAK